jgi:uncharacterized protein YyaL (SSP411 family)
VFWNALALEAFAEAGRYLRRSDYIELAIRNAHFLLTELRQDNRLFRSWRNGRARHNAYLEDYASLSIALLSLYQTDPTPHWFTSALQIADEMLTHFSDPAGGFYDTRDDSGPLITRPKDLQDNATPCGNSQAGLSLLQLSTYTGRSDLRLIAERMLGSIQEMTVRHPTSFANWLCAIDFAVHPTYEVVILGSEQDEHTQALLKTLWETYRPNIISARADDPPPPGSPPLLLDRHLVNNHATAYVCQNFVCKLPVTTPDALNAQLGAV